MSDKKLLLVDGNNYVNRGFYAVTNSKTKAGMRTSGVAGFFTILLADIHVLKPTHLVVVFDRKGGSSWRKKLYPEYKQNRRKDEEPTQEQLDLWSQYKPLKRLLKAIGIRICTKKGEEADDVIGTLAKKFADDGFSVIIGSKDKDFAQIVDRNITMLCSKTRKKLGPKEVKEKFGVTPAQFIDYLALIGDSSDNIPGVYKCGAVNAAKLIEKYGSIKEIVKHRKELTPALSKNVDNARGFFSTSTQLINLKLDVKLSTSSSNSKLPTVIANPAYFKKICSKLELVGTQRAIVSTLRRFNK